MGVIISILMSSYRPLVLLTNKLNYKNGVRRSLIPLLINFFQERHIMVKWNSCSSQPRTVKGGGPQGGTAGIVEYISLTNGNLNFLEDDEKFKFVDDASFLEILNILAVGLTSFNAKLQVPTDIATDNLYLPTQSTSSQSTLDKISNWTTENQMKLNSEKTKYMIINFCSSKQFQTRLYIDQSMIEQVRETQLLGVIISDDLTWHANTKLITKKANQRMIILRKLFEFKIADNDMLQIYKLFIRSVLETSCVVWATSITQEEIVSIERVQKIALKIIYKEKYISYENTLNVSKMPSLSERRLNLMLKFAQKCTKNEKTEHMFPLNEIKSTRMKEKYKVLHAYTDRLKNSAIPQMARQLNQFEANQK